MAGSFGYSRDHYEVSHQIGERRLLPEVRRAALVAGADAFISKTNPPEQLLTALKHVCHSPS